MVSNQNDFFGSGCAVSCSGEMFVEDQTMAHTRPGRPFGKNLQRPD
jgi:hypothetical protein